MLSRLRATSAELLDGQQDVADATLDAQAFANQAQQSIASSHEVIERAMDSVNGMIDLVVGLDHRLNALVEALGLDRKSGVAGKSGAVRVDPGGVRNI